MPLIGVHASWFRRGLLAFTAALLAGCGSADPQAPASTPTVVATPTATRAVESSPEPAPAAASATDNIATPAAADITALVPKHSPVQASTDGSSPTAVPAPAGTLLREAPDTRPAVAKDDSNWLPRLSGSSSDPGLGRSDSASGASVRKPRDASADPGGSYTWRDGDRTWRVWLQDDLVAQWTRQNTADDAVRVEGRVFSVVERRGEHDGRQTFPVFRSGSGAIMTLPGGVLLVLDEEWSATRVNGFFSNHGIQAADVDPQDFVPNAFLIATAPGFPSLNLANELADQDGVVLASPNWQTEVELR